MRSTIRKLAVMLLLLFCSVFLLNTCKPLLSIIEKSVLLPEYQLTIQPDGNGTVTPEGIHTVSHDIPFAVAASAAAGYFFDEWSVESGSGVAFADKQAASTTVALTEGDAAIQANFLQFTYQLTVGDDGNGSTAPSGTFSVNHGEQTAIAATPDGAYSFVNWSIATQDPGATVAFGDSNKASTWVSLRDGAATIRANFTLNRYDLTVTSDSNGTTNPAGTTSVAHGAQTEIWASANANYAFREWQVTQGSDVSFVNYQAAHTWVKLEGGNATIKAAFARIPVAAFQGTPTTANVPFTVNFTDTSTGEIDSWAWDFDNNGSTDSTLQNPSHSYTVKGSYSVKLTVSGPGGTDSETKSGYITANGVPSAPSSVTAVVKSGSQIDLTWTDNAGDESSYEVWRNKDGGSYSKISGSLSANTKAYSDQSIVDPADYRYAVKAVNQAGSSTWAYSPTRTTEWLLKTPASAGDVGISPSLMIANTHNTPRISYYDMTNKDLRYAYEALGGTWYDKVIDSDGSSDIGRGSSFAITEDWEMRISYKKGAALRYAYHHPSLYWQPQTVDAETNSSTATSMALYGTGREYIRIITMDWTLPGDIRLFTNTGGAWSTMDTGVGVADLTQTALGVSSKGLPRFCYYQDGDLKYAWYYKDPILGYRWRRETVEGIAANWEKTYSMAVDGSSYSHVAYLDTTNKLVKYAKKNSQEAASTWSKQTAYNYSYALPSGGKVALCLDGKNQPHIAAAVGGQLIYTRKTGTVWISEVVDSSTELPTTPAIAIDGLGRIHIAYGCNARDLKYARKE